MSRKSPEELFREGWTARNTASGHRLEEIMDEYRALGFEVLAQPTVGLGASSNCQECIGNEKKPPEMRIFTRPSGK